MRIPVEHFSTIPVFALSPMNPLESQSKRIELDQSLAPINNNNNSQKLSLPNGEQFVRFKTFTWVSPLVRSPLVRIPLVQILVL